MSTFVDPLINGIDALFHWFGEATHQSGTSYCELETADSRHSLVSRNGSLISLLRIHGSTRLVGPEEFERIHKNLSMSLQAPMGRPGHAFQVYFAYDKGGVKGDIQEVFAAAEQTTKRLGLDLEDLFRERINHLSQYCASEQIYLVLWTRPTALSKAQMQNITKQQLQLLKQYKVPAFRNAQNFIAAIPDLRETHDSFVRSVLSDLNDANVYSVLLDVHTAVREIRKSVDPEFTDRHWSPVLPGDKIPMRAITQHKGDISELLWPPLRKQVIPRDGELVDLRTTRIGDRIYGSVFIDLFPKEVQTFTTLFDRMRNNNSPWRISFMVESDGIRALGLKPTLASILSFASTQNRLISSASDYLHYINDNTDDSVVRLRVAACTWAPAKDERLLRQRVAEMAKAIQGWGYCEVSEISGDAFAGALSSALCITTNSVATSSIAPLSDVIFMLPYTRPASPWNQGAILFRSPDGKPWAYQPGSSLQTTWIDLIFARPGSGKSVLSNSINLALCLQSGIARLPRIAIIDIGPSSSGLISLLKEALPKEKQHLVAYRRLRMTPAYSINPFDTQLGCRKPTAQERSFLVNFLTLLATPVGQTSTYDGISDMAGMLVDELYTTLLDDKNPHRYTTDLQPQIDKHIQELGLQVDKHTTWWEITDALFQAGYIHEAMLAQRYAMPLLADAVAICRSKPVEDLYGKIQAPTGESLINAFSRMISAAVREYPILSRVTSFDLGDARVVSLDLDEVAKSGGEAADRQTAVMYMLARYVLARHYYLTEDNVNDMPKMYQEYHRQRVLEIREDPKRIVFDEFHRTANAQAVRNQVLVDMREGRKWKVQVALLSQSLDDFDDVMVEFATSVFIMDAGPKQAVDKTCDIFGLSPTARLALETRVHGPRAGGATFLAQFSTKFGTNTQLLTSTIGPIELWSFNTNADDARLRNILYDKIGALESRKILATLYPSGSASQIIEERLSMKKQSGATAITEEEQNNVISQLAEEILQTYKTISGGDMSAFM